MTCVQIAFIDIYLTFTSVLLQPSDGKHSTSIILIQSGCLSNIAPPTFNLSRDLLTQHASVCGYPGLFLKINSQEEKWWRSGHLSLLWFCEVGRKQTGLDNKTELTRLNGSEPSLMSLVTPAASECLQRAAESYMCFLQDAIQAIQLKVSQYFVCLEHRKFLWNQKETAGNSSPETVTVELMRLFKLYFFIHAFVFHNVESCCSSGVQNRHTSRPVLIPLNSPEVGGRCFWIKMSSEWNQKQVSIRTSRLLHTWRKNNRWKTISWLVPEETPTTFWVYFTFRDLLWVIWREAFLRTDLSVVLNHRRLEFQF